MINFNKVNDFIKDIKIEDGFVDNRKKLWHELLGTSPETKSQKIIEQAIYGSIGQFNFWEDTTIVGEGVIAWAENRNSSNWYAFIRDDRVGCWGSMAEKHKLNLIDKRLSFLSDAERFIKDSGDLEKCIKDPVWWNALSAVFGGDPLKKRETLLWITLTDLGFKVPEQKRGCIDYNIILLFRYLGLIKGYAGNIFTLYEETKIRYECLTVINYILGHSKQHKLGLTISNLDAWLWAEGRKLRRSLPREVWDPSFCYRFGCFFY
jgi:hypothetical protein